MLFFLFLPSLSLSILLYKAASLVWVLYFHALVLQQCEATSFFVPLFYRQVFYLCSSRKTLHYILVSFVSSSRVIHAIAQLQFFSCQYR